MMMKMLTVLAFSLSFAQPQAQQFALRDGDAVVFYGDSITAQRLYTRFVEEAVLTRYPGLHVSFVNQGVPGDTVFGGYAGEMKDRVRQGVAPIHPAKITVLLGMNDGGYGYTPAATVHANFVEGYAKLLDELHRAAPEASFTLINPTPYDEVTHGTEFAGYGAMVGTVSDDVTSIAAEWALKPGLSVQRVDFHAPLVEALVLAKTRFPALAPLLIPDRIHPAEAAHWIMASELLEAWHIDPVVSEVALNTERASVIETRRSSVSKIEMTSKGLRWSVLEEALPLPLDFNHAMTAVLLGVSNIERVDQQILRVEGLVRGQYQLLIDAKVIRTFSSEELKRGVNLALLKTPMWEQARGIDFLEERRAVLDQARFVLKAEVKGTSTSAATEDRLQEASEELAATVRSRVTPKPHDFELRRQ